MNATAPEAVDRMERVILYYAMYNHECFSLPLVNYAKSHFGWTALQFSSVAYLKRFGQLSMSELARYLFVSKQQATQLVSSLVKHGLATRLQSETNRRIIYVSATKMAVSQLVEAENAFIKLVKDRLTTYTDSDADKILNAMELMTEFLRTNSTALLQHPFSEEED